MPIVALPPATVRAIGSTSVISDACSLVKELLDNALDAGASSVTIEISQNTLDVIQVKDNGHGIPSQDHGFVCKRTFTSKIQTVEDLKNIGGSSLGFRGEALASAAEMSGSLTVVTRTEAELVGTAVKYGRDGEIVSINRASHPVGTSIRMTDFLKHIPVRKQTALKSAGKTLTKIKKMLHVYAMAQPTKRLSFRVLKAKNESNNWMYAPGQNATLVDAALKITGKDVASNCLLKRWPPEEDSTDIQQNQLMDISNFKLVAFLPKADSDISKVYNGGQYFIVDGRPVSTSRGIGHKITKVYKSYLRSTCSSNDHSPNITDPFICLHIQCPQGTYDVNIEPAKDDVLFEDADQVLSFVEDLFRDTYGELSASEKSAAPAKGKEKAQNSNGFDLLMARKDSVQSTPQHRDVNDNPIVAPLVTTYSQFKSPLPSTYRRRDFQSSSPPGTEQTINQATSKDVEIVSPWSMTRLNVPIRTPEKSNSAVENRMLLPKHNAAKEHPRRHRALDGGQPSSPALPSPSTSNSNSASPTNIHHSQPLFQFSQTSPTTPAQNDPKRAARERDKERYGNGALDTWFVKTTQATLDQNNPGNQLEQDEDGPSLTQLARERFGREQSLDTASNDVEDRYPQRESPENTPNTSNVSQSPPENITSSLGSRPVEIPEQRRELPVLETWAARLHKHSEKGINSDLEDALDFERRKKEAIQQRREQKRNRHEIPSSSNPHQSRYLAARAVLNSDLNDSTEQPHSISADSISRPRLNPYDPRAYLMRQQSDVSKNGLKARRTNTSKLPLEKISEDCDIHDLCLRLPASEPLLSNTMKHTLKEDLYTRDGTHIEAFTASDSDDLLEYWSHRLSNLTNEQYRTKDQCREPNLNFNFTAVIEQQNGLEPE
ncbi:hypothetical protein ASPWEDRAFT_118456 [Aspergillus wentii DTO 134E9]|uniref:DNA mismatch repair protein S5 domain-containing protein n=1 Tax=Aspergillus wentii DTO 134E9 TaxID=1073089 RepID=A0A1L9R8I1_ASPWE|nr:uncharacterized protein ASPWEDRAFT_118456 [Aspergillus wentii DTO 134E9]OJJ31232.1 hypothetical protein ASPWEDRAFT_118456 [Aspergillus wentii DTO 134E9]